MQRAGEMFVTDFWQGKKVAVVGGAGFIGSYVVDRLIEENPATIVVVDNLSLGKRSNLNDAVDRYPVQLLIENAANFPEMHLIVDYAKPDIVFSLATAPLPQSLASPMWASGMIYQLGLTMCGLAREFGFRLIHVSSSEVYGEGQYFPMDEEHPFDVTTPYAAAKAAVDLVIPTFGVESIIVRPFNAYGPRQNFGEHAAVIPETLRRIFAGESPVVYGDGKQARDFTYVSDVADAIVKMAEEDNFVGRVVNVGSGIPVKILSLIDRLCIESGYTGTLEWGPARSGDHRKQQADITKLEGIGWVPQVSLEEGLGKTVGWYREELRSE